jgi:hypothetical protein
MSSELPDRATRYEGFSDFQSVSQSVAAAVEEAVDAYAIIQSKHAEGARVRPPQAAEAASKILGAALKLLPELEQGLDETKEGQELAEQWTGDDGFIERLKAARLATESPDWLGDFVVQIRRAAWELGYLQAGTTVKEEPDDPVEAETEAMFDDL